MKLAFKSLLIMFLVVGFNPAHANPLFGRYVGVLKHETSGREQLAKLDFVVSRASTNELELKAVLTLHFGDFKSGEYVSFHYDKVRYNLLSGALTFDDVDQALSIFVKGFTGNKLEGEVTSLWAGRVGTLSLSQKKNVAPEAPLIEPIWGEYAGTCGDYKTKLQLYTYRSTEDSAHQAQPFASYFIKGTLAIDCRDGSCTLFRFGSGAYNYFSKKEQLSLVGKSTALRCDVTENALHCTTAQPKSTYYYDLTNCNFKRISNENAKPRQFSPVENQGVFNTQPNPSGTISEPEVRNLQSGEYKGYVFHEYLGKYQAASLNINVFQSGTGSEGSLKISSHAKLFFGDHTSVEMIPYRFSEKVYPNPLIGPQNLVLSRIDGNTDAVVQITESKDGVLRGIWYSILFGRVGPFELRKEGLPKLPAESKKLESLSGVYRSTKTFMAAYEFSQWVVRLMVSPGIKPSNTSENPFFPNLLRGSMYLYPVTASLQIRDGSYDFYTGRFGFSEGSDETDHGWVGKQNSKEELELYHLIAQGILKVPKHRPEIFRWEKGIEK